MQAKSFSVAFTATLALSTLARLLTSTPAVAQTEKVLFSFQGKKMSSPAGHLIFDSAGNLYGTTGEGGMYGDGSVFELSPKPDGGWTEQVLHSFNFTDGKYPYANLIFDAVGNLYGTTLDGGAHANGTVFELLPKVGGGCTEKVLHNFSAAGTEGTTPFTNLIFDAAGNLYGTAYSGGDVACVTNNGGACGTVFELSPAGAGDWTLKVLHKFHGIDGAYPAAGLIFDRGGNLYGTTSGGGPDVLNQLGTVFELSRSTSGAWTEKVLHDFNAVDDGNQPLAGLIFDTAGNLYGTTPYGGDGAGSVGTVFELSPTAAGHWMEKVLYSFNTAVDGAAPRASLIFDVAGNLYGTTSLGGAEHYGTVFELSPAGVGDWTEKVLHSFTGRDGNDPQTSLIMDAVGNLYGTTIEGGAHNDGTVFEITP
jgi:uncharacterized repeat protein (TIGR03803 family)